VRQLIRAARLVTCDDRSATRDDALGVLEDAAIVLNGDVIERVVAAIDLGDDANLPVLVRAPLVTPGLVDTHTHAAWVGSRHAEYAVRMAGGDYVAIAAAGGGIAATQRAVAAASEDAIHDALVARLGRMARLGVTTVEVKSGYGLVPREELKLLRAIARDRKCGG
jgi:imidazolonepropionase